MTAKPHDWRQIADAGILRNLIPQLFEASHV